MTLLKKLFSILFTLALAYPVCGQISSSATIVIIDAVGNKDSVMIGNPSNSTLGVDPEWEEENLYGQPWGDLEIRSIIRPVMCCPQCMPPFEGYTFEYDNLTLELKRDYRPQFPWNAQGEYTFAIKAINYPVTIIGKGNLGAGLGGTGIFYDTISCQIYGGAGTIFENFENTIITITEDYKDKWLRLYFQYVENVPIVNMVQSIVPNPTTGISTINFGTEIQGCVKVFSSSGKQVHTLKLNGDKETKLDFSNLTNGLYMALIYNACDMQVGTAKIIVFK